MKLRSSILKSLQIIFLLYWCLINIAISQVNREASESAWVGGRVLDSSGKPLAGALVSILPPPCRGCPDVTISATRTNSEGLFAMPLDSYKGSRVSVMIEQAIPRGFWSPFFADSHSFSKAGIHGIPITVLNAVGAIQLGDVHPTIEYGTRVIDLNKLFGKKVEVNDAIPKRLTISKGRVIIYKDITIPRSALAFGKVRLALPRGQWRIEITNGSSLKSKKTFSLNM